MTRSASHGPQRLAQRAYAKINLGLQILGRRDDSYHEIRTILQSISLHDELLLQRASGDLDLRVRDERCRGPGWPRAAPVRVGEASEVPLGRSNLVVRAAAAFTAAAGVAPRVRIVLRKRIPLGAGLGGGSSDAAAALIGLNRLHGFPLDAEALHRIATRLGSDVPFFLRGGTVLGLGRGEILRPLRDLEPCWLVLLVPPFGVSTAEAYARAGSALTRRGGRISIYRFWRQELTGHPAFRAAPNDFERVVASSHRAIGRLIERLWAEGAIAAAMTGSGSAIYGLFAGRSEAYRAWRNLTGLGPVARAWLGRTVGRVEYSAPYR